MTKISLGPTQGAVDDEEFDVPENILTIVRRYDIAMKELAQSKDAKIEQIEAETEEARKTLKKKFIASLNAHIIA